MATQNRFPDHAQVQPRRIGDERVETRRRRSSRVHRCQVVPIQRAIRRVVGARQLDRRQDECAELNVTISDGDKILHFIGEMFASELFDRKFLDDWEDEESKTWSETIAHFGEEYGKISRARERAAERAGSDYSSAAVFTQRSGAKPVPDTIAAVTEYANAQREYANALELRVDELQTLVDDQSILTSGTELAAAATTATTSPSAELLEMRALHIPPGIF